jgi:hypothetical protein
VVGIFKNSLRGNWTFERKLNILNKKQMGIMESCLPAGRQGMMD